MMLRLAMVFSALTLVTAVLGFSGITESAASVAEIMFWLSIAILLMSLVLHVIWDDPQ